MSEMTRLKESVDLENRADLMAAACNFGEASRLMGEANKIRRQQFGALDPNRLRELTHEALRDQAPPKSTGSTVGPRIPIQNVPIVDLEK